MVLEKFSFYIGKKRKSLLVKKVCVFSPGLVGRKNSPALLWEVRRERNLDIFSLFCRPFIAIWLDKNKKALKIASVKNWKLRIPGFGKYLLEIPEADENYLKMTKATNFSDGRKRKGLNIKTP